MPYYRCGSCGLTSYSAATHYTAGRDSPSVRCPGCSATLGGDGVSVPLELGAPTASFGLLVVDALSKARGVDREGGRSTVWCTLEPA